MSATDIAALAAGGFIALVYFDGLWSRGYAIGRAIGARLSKFIFGEEPW